MDFIVEFYETEAGACSVREFLDKLKAVDPDDFAAVHGIRNKGQAIPARDIRTARERMRDWRKRKEQ